MIAMGAFAPLIYQYSPFTPGAKSPITTPLSEPVVLGVGGCTSASSTGQVNCSASLSGGGTTSLFGSVVNTIMVFGNFPAAVNFLVQLSVGVILPGVYIIMFLGGTSNPAAVGIGGAFQTLVWFSYAEGLFYIISGRWLLT
jgi:hypothetical protein